MIVHRRVDVDIADPGVVMAKASVHTPAAAHGDSAELLDIDVDQIAWVFVLVAADQTPRGSIHQLSRFNCLAHEHAMHR